MPANFNKPSFNRFSKKALFNSTLLVSLYLIWIVFFVGFRSDHIFLICFCLTAYFLHPTTRRFIIAFFNFIGFIIYYLYPAAPPWYVDQYGFDFNLNTPASTAGLSRFDDYFGITLFHSLYSKNANIFAAIPSLHAAYPIVVLYFGIRRRMGWMNVLFFIFLSGIWFAAVYSGHHYIIDLLIGAACAFFSLFLFEYAF